MKHKNFKHFLQDHIEPSQLPISQRIPYILATDSKEIILWTLASLLTIVGIVAGFFFALPTSLVVISLTIATIAAGLSAVVLLDIFSKPIRKEMENFGSEILQNDPAIIAGFSKYQVSNPQTDLTVTKEARID